MEYFSYEQIASNVTKINDLFGVASFLVVGTRSAALLDTGCGAGDLKSLVESMTKLPISVICTHGHVDHAGGTYGFENVYLNNHDYDLVMKHTTLDFRKAVIEMSVDPGKVADEMYVPQRKDDYQNLLDGQIFDLGDITLEALAMPGHTQGTMCILLREMRTLLLGDACNTATFLFAEESTSVEQYRNNLQKFLRHENKYDKILFSHSHNIGQKTIINEGIDLCNEIMAGKTDNLPFNFMGEAGCLAKKVNPDYSRVDGKIFNIVFNPDKIFI
jgi:hydroxyacylglutathione hydrolase